MKVKNYDSNPEPDHRNEDVNRWRWKRRDPRLRLALAIAAGLCWGSVVMEKTARGQEQDQGTNRSGKRDAESLRNSDNTSRPHPLPPSRERARGVELLSNSRAGDTINESSDRVVNAIITDTARDPRRSWEAKWIWGSGEPDPSNFFLMARRGFELSSKPDSGVIHISAADRYQLFVNGRYVGRGPARSNPKWKSFDSYELSNLLNAGRNVVAVLAYHYGPPLGFVGKRGYRGGFYAAGERAGLWAQIEIGPDSARQVIATDPSWRVKSSAAYMRGQRPIVGEYSGYPEVFDAGKEPEGWKDAGFNDSAWQQATLVPDEQREWLVMEPRDVPLMRETELLPVKVISTGEVIRQTVGYGAYTPSNMASVPELMAREIHLPLKYAALQNVDSLAKKGARPVRVQSGYDRIEGFRDPYVILDFGRQLFGFPRIRLKAPAGAIVDIVPGQQLVGGRVPMAPLGLDDASRYIAKEGEQTWELFEYKQFRYLHICVRSQEPVELQSVALNAYQYPAQQRGQFECSDPILTKTWQACVDTAYLEMEDVLALDAWRERIKWSVPDAPQAIYAAFGDVAVLKRHHRLTARSDRGNGLLGLFYPPDEAGNSTPQVVAGLLLWLDGIEEYYRYVGDDALIKELYPAIQRQMDWFDLLLDDDGLLSDIPYQNYADQARNDIRGTSSVINGWYLIALDASARLADAVGDAPSASRWRAHADRVRGMLRSRFWNASRGLYEDSRYKGQRTGVFSEMANALALLTRVATKEQIPGIVARFGKDTDVDLVEASPIAIRSVLFGLAEVNLDTALDLIRRRYAPMMEWSDHPTVWEVWERFSMSTPIRSDAQFEEFRKQGTKIAEGPSAALSLAHGGCSPALFLSREVLGIKGVGAGFQECRIDVPRVKSVAWARGVFPSVRGDIKVDWSKKGSKTTLKLQLPKDLKTTIAVPADAQSISFDGRASDARDIKVIGGSHQVEWTQ